MTTNSIKTHRLTFPISAEQARQVRAGDQVLIDGEIIITAGLPTHERLLKCLDGEESPPMNLHGASLFHLGGYGRESGNGIELTTAVNETLLDTEEGEIRRNISNFYPKKITFTCSKIKNK